jgi:penicillin amidase
MRRLRKIMKVLLALLLIISVVLVSGSIWLIRRAATPVDGTLAVAGLQRPVQILRDQFGIPQIYAESADDLFFAQGYVHAQDRLWQMELNRRTGRGTLSAIFGESTLWLDRYVRIMGLRRAAEQELAQLPSESRAVLDAYARGVNAYMTQYSGRLPVEFTIFQLQPAPWEPLDTLIWGKVMSWNLSWNGELETLSAQIIKQAGPAAAQQLLPPYADGAPLRIPPEVDNYRQWWKEPGVAAIDPLMSLPQRPHIGKGSNNWVIDGSRTASGKPLLANDTHLSLGMPSIWYENGLHGGGFDVVGFSFPGVPLAIIGHNQRIAWGVTDFPADVQDYYIEKVDDPANPTRYEFEGRWRDVQTLREVIEVRGGDPVTEEIRLTQHGPLMNTIRDALRDTEPLALRWTLNDGTALFDAIRRLNLAGDWDAFRDALSGWQLPVQHFVYADVDGNIGYQTAGKLPLRGPDHQGLLPMPGWNGAYEWRGYLPFDQLYSVLNPAEHFFATANDLAAPAGAPQRATYGFQTSDDYRITRIKALLQERQQATVEDMARIQADNYSLPAEIMRPYLLQTPAADPLQQQALDALKAWNLRYDQDQAGAAIFQIWIWRLSHEMIGDDLGDDLLQVYEIYGWVHMPALTRAISQPDNALFDDRATAKVETRDDLLRSSLAEAITWLRERYGDDPRAWTWGRLHTVTLVHQPLGQLGVAPLDAIFNSDTIPSRGGPFVINNSWLSTDGAFKMTGGTAQRMIIDLGDLQQSRAINSSGQSELVGQPHRQDMLRAWEAVQYHPLVSAREQAERLAQTRLVLTPP